MFSKMAKLFILVAIVCIFIAVGIKAITLKSVLPGSMPLNWAKLADTFLLFSIAASLVTKK